MSTNSTNTVNDDDKMESASSSSSVTSSSITSSPTRSVTASSSSSSSLKVQSNEHSHLYKSRPNGGTSHAESQAKRRAEQLEYQRKIRDTKFDDLRSAKLKEQINKIMDMDEDEIKEDINTDTEPNDKVKNKNKNVELHTKVYDKRFENTLQLSEWMREKPKDIDNWLLVFCPKGKRCLMAANKGKTKVFDKYGLFLDNFGTNLPGSQYKQSRFTILDCIRVPFANRYYILDVLMYNNLDLMNCPPEQRFEWIRSRINDNNLSVITKYHQRQLCALPYVHCGDTAAIDNLLKDFPMWPKDKPQLDGLLFFHKDSYYVSGPTPLVSWILPFMLPAILNVKCIHEGYLQNEKPINYLEAIDYMTNFDEAQLQKRQMVLDKTKECEMEEMDDNIKRLHELDETIHSDTEQQDFSHINKIITDANLIDMDTPSEISNIHNEARELEEENVQSDDFFD